MVIPFFGNILCYYQINLRFCSIPLSLQQFLEKTAYPLLEGSSSFLLDWLIQGHREYLETNPSTSPEHYFIAPDGKKACVSYSTTMDMSIIREVFSAVILSADVSHSSILKEKAESLSCPYCSFYK